MSDVIIERTNWLDSHFYIETEICENFDNCLLLRRKKYYGLSMFILEAQIDILPTIYDSIVYYAKSILKVTIVNKIGFYDLHNKQWICEPICDEAIFNDFYQTVELIVDGKHGLLDISSRRVVIPILYEDVTTNSMNNYLWVKTKVSFGFINKQNGRLIGVSNAILAYDHPNYMFVKLENGRVVCVNETGNKDEIIMRKQSLINNGRIEVKNIKYHISEIVDLYGYVLN